MKIGIIGAGNVGTALANHFHKLNHTVQIANSRGPETLSEVAKQTGATPTTVSEVAKGVELLVIAISEKAVPSLPKDLLRELPAGSPIIDTGNYIPLRDGVIAEIEGGLADSEWVSKVLGRTVLKAFNNIIAYNIVHGGLPKGSENRIALPVSGDDVKAKQFVIALLDDMGFDGVDAGPLSESWRQQCGTPAYTTDCSAKRLRFQLKRADRALAPSMRDIIIRKTFNLPPDTQLQNLSVEQLLKLPPGPPPQKIVPMVRAVWQEYLANQSHVETLNECNGTADESFRS